MSDIASKGEGGGRDRRRGRLSGRRRGWRLRRLLGALAAALLIYAMIPAAPARRIDDAAAAHAVWLVDHGYHANLLLPRRSLKGSPLAAAFPGAAWLEIGWGDEAFYLRALESPETPLDLAVPALLWPTPSVLHVAGHARPPSEVFWADRLLRLPADDAALAALAEAVDEALAAPLLRLSGGLYGPERSAFYRARGRYSALNVCNHWLSRALRQAGYPSTALWSTLPKGLFAELRWRLGAHGPAPP